MDYTIFYVDEDSADVGEFKRRFKDDFAVKTLQVTGDTDLPQIIQALEKETFNYLIVDYHLNDTTGCGFDGDEVIVGFLEKFPDFPVMMLTNHDEQAIDKTTDIDVERIRSKKEYTGEFKEAFVKRIKAKVDQYKEEHIKAEKLVEELLQKQHSGEALSAVEEEALIQHDTFIDKSLDGTSRVIPSELKKSTNTDKLNELLAKTETLIEKLEEYEDVSR